MKIALVSPYDYTYPGGVTEHVKNLACQMRARGHEVHVLAPSSTVAPGPAPATPYLHRIGGVVPVPANGSVVRTTLPLQGYLQVKRLLTHQSFDIVHLHEPMMPALPLTVLRHSSAINVGTFHAFGRSDIGYLYAKPMLQPFFRKLHGRIAVSRAARDFVARRFGGPYEIIPNGIDFARFATPHDRLVGPDHPGPDHLGPDDGLSVDRLDVLFVGRLEQRKGLAYLLRAWPVVWARFPNARLVVVGGGGRRLERYRRHAAAGRWPAVTFLGHVSSDDLVRQYQAADVFCAPSTGQESFGIVLLEAMAASCPIVASRIPGYAEVVTDGHEGVLVPPKDHRALATGLSTLLGDAQLRRALGARGRETARAYDWPKIADRVLAYYGATIDAQMESSEVHSARFGRVRRAASGVVHLLAR